MTGLFWSCLWLDRSVHLGVDLSHLWDDVDGEVCALPETWAGVCSGLCPRGSPHALTARPHVVTVPSAASET